MKPDLLQLAAELARRGEPFALATVVNRQPPISAQVGDVALVTQAGEFHGWVGGTCTRPTVIAEAARALADGRPRFIALDPQPGAHERKGLSMFPMTCHSGGSVEIYIQPVLPAPRLLVFGISPTAQALARLGKAMGYTVLAVDPQQPLAGHQPEPEEEGHRRLAVEVWQLLGEVDVRLLEHVRRVHPALETPVHPEVDHLAQPRLVAVEQVRQRPLIPAGRASRRAISR